MSVNESQKGNFVIGGSCPCTGVNECFPTRVPGRDSGNNLFSFPFLVNKVCSFSGAPWSSGLIRQ